MAQHGTKAPSSERSHLVRIRRATKSVGTYKPEFDQAARRLARIYAHIDRIEEKISDPEFEYLIEFTNKNGQTNTVKNPLLNTLESMYIQALTLERELGLTSAALKRIKNDSGGAQAQDPFEKLLTSS